MELFGFPNGLISIKCKWKVKVSFVIIFLVNKNNFIWQLTDGKMRENCWTTRLDCRSCKAIRQSSISVSFKASTAFEVNVTRESLTSSMISVWSLWLRPSVSKTTREKIFPWRLHWYFLLLATTFGNNISSGLADQFMTNTEKYVSSFDYFWIESLWVTV